MIDGGPPPWSGYTLLCPEDMEALREAAGLAPPGGEFLVCGSYRGGDAMFLRAHAGTRRIVVVDSFAGLADPGAGDAGGVHRAKEFACGRADYLANFRRAAVRPPDEVHATFITDWSLSRIPPRPLALLWLDLDHHRPTLDCLRYFWGWLLPGGVVLVHDYDWPDTPGIRRACDDFAAEVPGDWERVGMHVARRVKP